PCKVCRQTSAMVVVRLSPTGGEHHFWVLLSNDFFHGTDNAALGVTNARVMSRETESSVASVGVESVNALLAANSRDELLAHNAFAASKTETCASLGFYEVVVILTNAVTRENTTRVEVHIAWLRDFIHLLVVLANPTHDLVPHRDNRAVNNSVNEELNRLRKDLL